MERTARYPIGEQSFESLRREGFLYVDKTAFIEKIARGGKYYFLGRPRRFGKSLFLSTLQCFFQGKRDLFKGLYADTMSWDWERYPVLKLDLNIEKYKSPETLDSVIGSSLREWEKEYDIDPTDNNLSVRFSEVIKAAYERTGKGVVILVDEYDKPLVNNLQDREMFEYFRDRLAAIYSNFKSSADYIRLVFLTGVSRFGHLSVFSGLNNLRDISFERDFSAICGITESELVEYFKEGLECLAEENGESLQTTLGEVKRWYDGYRFAANGAEIYNPFSLLNLMESRMYENYWIMSGQATLLLEQLKRFDVDLLSLLEARCTRQTLTGLDLDTPRPVALLYQTGYLTIRNYDPRSKLYALGLPNDEVKSGFLEFLLPYYANLHNQDSAFVVSEFVREFREGDVDGFMNRLRSLFASVGYDMRMDTENNVHNALLMLMILVGLDVKTEYRTSHGRIDLFIATDRYYYIIELKLDGSARQAIDQINEKEYALPFAIDGRQLIRIGVNFSSATRTVDDWIVER